MKAPPGLDQILRGQAAGEFRLLVLNPRGRDPWRAFPDGAGSPADPGHAPVNFHAYAACTRGVYTDAAPASYGLFQQPGQPALVMLRRDLKTCLEAVRTLKNEHGCRVAVGLKETGTHQVADLLSKPGRLELLRATLAEAHGVIAATPGLVPFYRGLLPAERDPARVQFIPTPYPVGEPGWDFALPPAERRGIFIGTREFLTPSRNHLAALTTILPLARDLREPVTVFNTDGRYGEKMLAGLGYPAGLLKIHTGRRAYPDYLRELARHKIVWQLDSSHVPGQVAGDCLLAGVPCVGGNGAVDQLAFPELSGGPRPLETLLESARLLLEAGVYAPETAGLTFPLAAERLRDFFTGLK
jgi:hypothetical protein